MSEQHIKTTDLRKYRTELPNLYDDARLSPYEFRLLSHYVRVGNCYQSVRTTAEICCMSVGQVVKARESLEKGGWIKTTTNAEHGTVQIIVVDKWSENFNEYGKRSQDEQERSPHEHERSYHEPKKEPIKNKPNKKNGRDPRLDHPAIGIYQEVFRFHVPITLRDDVIRTVGDAEGNHYRWGSACKKWLAKGYNPRNLDGLLDYFKNSGFVSEKDYSAEAQQRRDAALAEMERAR